MALTADDPRSLERVRCARLIRDSIGLLASKWAVDVLLALGHGTRRYHELLSELDPISEKVLTQTLRAMERDGLIGRRVHPEVPPRVEYALTTKGQALLPIIDGMRAYGQEWLGGECGSDTASATPSPAVAAA